MTHPSDPTNMNTDDNLFSNIKRSHLHNIAARTHGSTLLRAHTMEHKTH